MKTIFISISILLFNSSFLFPQTGWIQQIIPNTSTGALTDIQFVNENTGWFCGQAGLLSKTTNGGITWNEILNNGGHYYNDIHFVNENTGFLAVYGMINKSTDGGNTWTVSTLLEDNSVAHSISFINENTGWVCARGIYKTTNAGNNWLHYNIHIYEHFNLYSISFPTINTGYCSGYYLNQFNGEYRSILAKSVNGGINWEILLEQTDNSFYDVQFLNENTGYVNGLPPIKTTNGGNTWKSILDSSGYYILAMYFTDPETGWFGSSNGCVYTNDGGSSWQNHSLSAQSNVHGFSFINNFTGWCVGMNNISYPRVFKTTTGGLTFIDNNWNLITSEYYLEQNYPNPFNPVSTLEFRLSKSGFATLKVLDITGKEIITIVNSYMQPGVYKYEFDAAGYSSGIYFYTLSVNNYTETKRMILLK